MDIDGIKVTVKGDPYPGEIEGYVRRGLREHGKRLTVGKRPGSAQRGLRRRMRGQADT